MYICLYLSLYTYLYIYFFCIDVRVCSILSLLNFKYFKMLYGIIVNIGEETLILRNTFDDEYETKNSLSRS